MIRLLAISLLLLLCLPAHAAAEADSLRQRLTAMADTASAPLLYRLSEVFEKGTRDMEPDMTEALRLLRRAADKDYAPALNLLGFKYFRGEGMAADTAAGLRLIERAAELGDPRSFNNLGWLYLTGDVLAADSVKAAYWLGKAAQAGVPTAMATLGDMHRDRRIAESDSMAVVRADSLYTAAIAAGLADAQFRLLSLREENYRQLSADSALRLGMRYWLRRGPAVAVALFRRAAELGDSQAEALLGDAYSRAVGVPYDHRKSLTHFYRAAAAGNPSAQFVVAELLDLFPDALLDISDDDLTPLTPRIADATYWYARAAEAGIDSAEKAADALIYLHPDNDE